MESRFFRYLKLVGFGFKARTASEGRELFLRVGYSHEIHFPVPPAVRVVLFEPNVVCCTGIDRWRVHDFAGAVRACKPRDVYNGKGVYYLDEVVMIKLYDRRMVPK